MSQSPERGQRRLRKRLKSAKKTNRRVDNLRAKKSGRLVELEPELSKAQRTCRLKRSYSSLEDGMKARLMLSSRRELFVYACSECELWHLTSQKRKSAK